MPKFPTYNSLTNAVIAEDDVVLAVDVSDTTDDSTGSTRKLTRRNLLSPTRLTGRDWRPSPNIGPELWTLANFQTGYNTTVLSPTLTANGTNQVLRTRVSTGTNIANGDICYRFKCTVTSSGFNGWYTADIRLTGSTASNLSGTQTQTLMNSSVSTGMTTDFVIEFKCPPINSTLYFELQLNVYNNSTAGTITVSNCSLREIAHVTRPLYLTESYLGSPGYPQVWCSHFAPDREEWRLVYNDMNGDGALTYALNGATGFNTDRPWGSSGAPPDPTWVNATSGAVGNLSNPQTVLQAGQTSRAHRSNNNDQILEVLKQDGVTYELRCNTHGGETNVSTSAPNLKYEYDLLGDGTWVSIVPPFGKFLRPVQRVRWTWNTQVARSAPDSDTFANVNHVTTFFPDGVIRTDRTTSFLKTITLRTVFDWMNSFDTTVPRVGRIGKGLVVLDQIDTFTKASAPTLTPSTSTTGGTLAAATYMYRITALTEGGESTPSAVVTQATTGTTSTVTLTWTGVTGATGYRIYGRTNAVERQVLLATVGASATTWTDDGSAILSGTKPPVTNTARRMDIETTLAVDTATSADATWMVWYDEITNLCHASIWDRDAMLSRTGVASFKHKILSGAAIVKTYTNTYYTGGAETITVNSSTVWTATHWLYTYCPADPARYHLEAALKAADLAALKDLYPST